MRETMMRIPQPGDVLVSKVAASVEHEVSIVPAPPAIICRNARQATAQARELARKDQVDAWLTLDHTHFAKIASFRDAGSLAQAAS